MIIEIYRVEKETGIWTAQDFPVNLRDKVTIIKQQLDELENLGVE